MTPTEQNILKEINKSKKCKICIQLNEDFGTDCPKHMKAKSKLEGYQLAQKENQEQIKSLTAECQEKYELLNKIEKETAEKVRLLKNTYPEADALHKDIDKIFKEKT